MGVHKSVLFTNDEQGKKMNNKAMDLTARVNYAIDFRYAKTGNPPEIFRLNYKRFFLMREYLLSTARLSYGVDAWAYSDSFLFRGVRITVAYADWKKNAKYKTKFLYEALNELYL